MQHAKGGIRLAIAGGGTGGHVLPAVAVVEELKRRGGVDEVIWIGSRDGVEREAAAAAGIRFVAIPTGKLRRYFSLRNAIDAVRVPLGIVAARRALGAFHPDVLLSTGGFVSVPSVIAARGIAPVLTHEQTAVLGLATRLNARFADVLAVSYDQTADQARRIHRKVTVTGNPVRAGLGEGDRQRGLAWLGFTSALPVVYVTGGARGASPLNHRIADLLPDLLEHVQVLHQTGPATANQDAQALIARQSAFPEHMRHRYKVVEFVGNELADVYAAADLIVGRAGAGTIAELAAVGKAALLIPLPGTGGDEQTANARILADAGAAEAIPQEEATPQRLRAEILAIIGDPDRRKRMEDAARTVARPDAASRLADVLLGLASRRLGTTAR